MKLQLLECLETQLDSRVLNFEEICDYLTSFTAYLHSSWLKSMLYQKNGSLNSYNNDFAERITFFTSRIEIQHLAQVKLSYSTDSELAEKEINATEKMMKMLYQFIKFCQECLLALYLMKDTTEQSELLKNSIVTFIIEIWTSCTTCKLFKTVTEYKMFCEVLE